MTERGGGSAIGRGRLLGGAGRLPRLALLALPCLVALPATALHPATRLYDQRDGLPQSRVTAVTQDARGYLWVGTQRGGLARYDGQAWRSLDTADGLPSNDVRWIAPSPSGELFVGTAAGFGRLRDDRFERLGPVPDTADRLVRVVEASSKGMLWVGQRTGLALWREPGTTTPVPLGGKGAQPDVNWIASDGFGGVYVATSEGLAHVGAPPDLAFSWVMGLPAGEVSAAVRRKDGSLAVSVDLVGLFVGKPGSFVRVGDDRSPGRRVIALFDDGEEGLLAGTIGRGAFRCRDRCEPLVGEDLRPDGMVFDIFRDRERVLWFATDSGLGKRVDSAFRSFDSSDSFPETEWLYGMAEGADGAVWVAASGGNIVRIGPDGAVRTFSSADGLPGTLVTHVLTRKERREVLVCTRRGLYRFDGKRFVFEPLAPGIASDLNAALEAGGGLYVATWNKGLYFQKEGASRRVPAPVGSVVEVLAPLRDGKVACGGAGFGVAILEEERVVGRITARDGLPSEQVNGILEDSRGALWVATEAGAWCRRPDGTHFVVDRAQGLPANYVTWVAEARDGAHWFGTNHGVVRRSPDGALERFTKKDGLARNECSPSSVLVDSRGRLFVGSSSLSLFERRPAPPRALPLVHVETDPGQEQLPGGRGIRVPAGGEVLHLRFTSPSFVDEQAVSFRFRLVGLSDRWRASEPGQRSTTYGRLPPGPYRFEVEAVAADGRRSATPAALEVTVEPAWWQRRGVHLAGLAIAVAGGLAALRLRDRRHALAEAHLKALVDERTEELRKLNERLGEQAVTDELTGISNRRGVMQHLVQTASLARRQGLPLSIALVDLDGFKEVNDTYGHPLGDDCLRWVAGRLASALRAGDHLGRMGGDEFLGIFAATGLEGARTAAERMAVALREAPWTPPGGGGARPPKITISVGLAEMREGDAGLDDLVVRADGALYEAKRAGRELVVAAP